MTIEKRVGTIAKVLNDHKKELFELIDKGDMKGCKQKTISLLDDESITDKQAIVKAKKALSTKNDNLFLSCLCTYMSGIKVS